MDSKDQYEQDLEAASEHIAKLEAEHDELRAELAEWEIDLARMKAERDELNSTMRRDAELTASGEMRERMLRAEAQCVRLKDEHDSWRRVAEKLAQERIQMQTERDKLQSFKDYVHARLDLVIAERDKLRAKCDELAGDNERLIQASLSDNDCIAELQAERDEYALLLDEAVTELTRNMLFLVTRQKIHPDGATLCEDLCRRILRARSKYRALLAEKEQDDDS